MKPPPNVRPLRPGHLIRRQTFNPIHTNANRVTTTFTHTTRNKLHNNSNTINIVTIGNGKHHHLHHRKVIKIRPINVIRHLPDQLTFTYNRMDHNRRRRPLQVTKVNNQTHRRIILHNHSNATLRIPTPTHRRHRIRHKIRHRHTISRQTNLIKTILLRMGGNRINMNCKIRQLRNRNTTRHHLNLTHNTPNNLRRPSLIPRQQRTQNTNSNTIRINRHLIVTTLRLNTVSNTYLGHTKVIKISKRHTHSHHLHLHPIIARRNRPNTYNERIHITKGTNLNHNRSNSNYKGIRRSHLHMNIHRHAQKHNKQYQKNLSVHQVNRHTHRVTNTINRNPTINVRPQNHHTGRPLHITVPTLTHDSGTLSRIRPHNRIKLHHPQSNPIRNYPHNNQTIGNGNRLNHNRGILNHTHTRKRNHRPHTLNPRPDIHGKKQQRNQGNQPRQRVNRHLLTINKVNSSNLN